MIVYVVKRKWFEKFDHAEAYRKEEGLKPSATVKVSVSVRQDLCALLNALCDPPLSGSVAPVAGRTEPIVPSHVIDEACVSAAVDVPDFVPRFLLDDEGKKLWDERHACGEIK